MIHHMTNPIFRKGALDTLLDTAFKSFQVPTESTYSISSLEVAIATSMPIDIKDERENIVIRAELPGREAPDLKIELDKNVLIIESLCGKSYSERDDFIVNERYLGKYKRAISLPDSINTDEISSDYKDGILTIRLPKLDNAKTKLIPIN